MGGNDDMVEHVDAQCLASIFQSLRHSDVFAAGRWVARWVVVDKDD